MTNQNWGCAPLIIMDSLKPPAAVRQAAARGLELRRKFGRGGLSTQEAGKQGIGSGVARATSLANGKAVTPDTIKRMASYFARHAVDKQGKGWGDEKNPSAGYIAWLLWGGDAGRAWATRLAKSLDERSDAYWQGYESEWNRLQAIRP